MFPDQTARWCARVGSFEGKSLGKVFKDAWVHGRGVSEAGYDWLVACLKTAFSRLTIDKVVWCMVWLLLWQVGPREMRAEEMSLHAMTM